MPTKKPSRKDSWKKLGMAVANCARMLPKMTGGYEPRLYEQDNARLVARARALRAATRKKGKP